MRRMIFTLGECLTEISEAEWKENPVPAVFVTHSREARETLHMAEVGFEGEIKLSAIGFCKLENQQESLAGTFCIPKLLDVLGSRYKIQFFVNQKNIVLIDDDEFSLRLIRRIQYKLNHQGETKERFIYNYMAEFMSRDLEVLVQYERHLLDMEERANDGKIEGYQRELLPVRRELLTLRSYYDEIRDMGKELEENENGFFVKKQLKFFGTLADRGDRLMNKTGHLLEYAQQIKDSYQAQIDAKQNKNMEFLTIVSTIFFPLTLITGWYGMNFRNMPELEQGYPYVITLSLIVVAIIIIIFKRRDIF